jgi:hypothetical protein
MRNSVPISKQHDLLLQETDFEKWVEMQYSPESQARAWRNGKLSVELNSFINFSRNWLNKQHTLLVQETDFDKWVEMQYSPNSQARAWQNGKLSAELNSFINFSRNWLNKHDVKLIESALNSATDSYPHRISARHSQKTNYGVVA